MDVHALTIEAVHDGPVCRLATHMMPVGTGTQTDPSDRYLRRAVSAFLAEVPGSEVVTARLRRGSA
jgi:hypothetical protein